MNSQNRKGQNILFVFFLFACLIITCGYEFSPLDKVYSAIKDETAKALSDAFNKKVTIEKVEGYLVGSVTFKGVRIEDSVDIPEMVVNFNPATFAYSRDILKALTKIVIKNGKLNLTAKDYELELPVSIEEPDSSSKAPPTLPFKGRIVLENCNVSYFDKSKEFRSGFKKVNGEVNLSGSKVGIYISGLENSSSVLLKGEYNLKKESYAFTIDLKNLQARPWGKYIVPDLPFESGTVSGKLTIINNDFTMNLFGIVNDSLASFSGEIRDIYKQPIFDLKGRLKNLNLDEVKKIIPDIAKYDFSGKTNLVLAVNGKMPNLQYAFDFSNVRGTLFGVETSGEGKISLVNNKLMIERAKFSSFDGTLALRGQMDFNYDPVRIDLVANTDSLDLEKIFQKAPGFEGRTSFDLTLEGDFRSFSGVSNLKFKKSYIFGQRVDSGKLSFRYVDGRIDIQEMFFTSEKAKFAGTGKISPDLDILLSTSAKGIKIKGEGIFGDMHSTIDSFDGQVAFRPDEYFLQNPIKHLKASGKFFLTDNAIGKQKINSASGEATIDNGKIDISQITISVAQSTIVVSGQTGIGFDTDLKVTGKQISLEDLKILEYVLPERYNRWKGKGNIDMKISGRLPENITNAYDFFSLNFYGQVALTEATIAGVDIKKVECNVKWENGDLFVEDTLVNTEKSALGLSFKIDDLKKINLNLSGDIDIDDFKKIFMDLGRFDGKGKINISATGDLLSPEVTAALDFENVVYDGYEIEELQTNILFSNNRLKFLHPLKIVSYKGTQTISGDLKLTSNYSLEEVNLKIKIKDGDLEGYRQLALIFQKRYKISQAKATPLSALKAISFSLDKLKNIRVILYSQVEESFFEYWDEFQEGLKEMKKEEEEIIYLPEISGKLSGELVLNGKISSLKGRVKFNVPKPVLNNYSFDNLQLSAEFEGSKVKMKKALLKEKRGEISLSGEIDSAKGNKLTLNAKRMPIDILQLVFPEKDFSGEINSVVFISGTFASPIFEVAFNTSSVTLAGAKFKQIKGKVSLNNGDVNISQLQFRKDGLEDSIQGKIGKNFEKINLIVDLEGGVIGLANLFTDEFRYIDGNLKGKIKIFKNGGGLSVLGSSEGESLRFYLKALDSYFTDVSLQLQATGKKIELNRLMGYWYGNGTSNNVNSFSATGYLNLHDFSSALRLADNTYWINFPDVYKGKVSLSNVLAYGTLNKFYVKGDLFLEDGTYLLPKGRENGRELPIFVDINLSLGKDVFLSTSDILTFDFSNIYLNLEMEGKDITIKGAINSPDILGNISFIKGNINIFDREFLLLSDEDQKKFLGFEEIRKNTAYFSGQGHIPKIDLVAIVTLLPPDKAREEGYKDLFIISILSGVPFSEDPNKAISIKFRDFYEDPQTRQIVRAGLSEEDIRLTLLPGFVKGLIGLEDEGVDASKMVTDYVGSRLQRFLFRKVERGVERVLGLERLTLEYNIGQEIQEAFGREENGPRREFGVGFMKGFFDRVYIDVKYSEGLERAGEENTRVVNFNYQVIYKLSRTWAIAYYMEPVSLSDLTTGYNKTTLTGKINW